MSEPFLGNMYGVSGLTMIGWMDGRLDIGSIMWTYLSLSPRSRCSRIAEGIEKRVAILGAMHRQEVPKLLREYTYSVARGKFETVGPESFAKQNLGRDRGTKSITLPST